MSVLRAVTMGLAVAVTSATAQGTKSPVLMTDAFEAGLDQWRIVGSRGVSTRESGDPAHGRVLVLSPHGDVLALIKGSEAWRGVRLEADVLFPDEVDNYLGVAFNHTEREGRHDAGLVYIKGNDNYLQANPYRDFNVSRLLYPEYRVTLEGDAAFVPGQWKRIAAEIVGRDFHFYVEDMDTPKMTFPMFEGDAGALGLSPRSVGGDVWVDNVVVRDIDGLSYTGPARPALAPAPAAMITSWQVAGPFAGTRDELAEAPVASPAAWRPFETDPRGAVVTSRVADYHGPRAVAYFRTEVQAPATGEGTLELSTIDDLAVWVNGRFHWFVSRGRAAWFDFATNPKHEPQRIPIPLVAGTNDIVIRVRGGVYASGGFFARVPTPGS